MDDHLELLLNGQLYKKLNEVVYKPYMHDRRCIHLELQDKAFPVIDYVKIKQKELIEIIFNGMTDEEKRIIRGIAEKISSNIAEVLETSSR